MTPAQQALLDTPMEEVPEVQHRHGSVSSGSTGMDVHSDRQRYLADANSQWEVTVGGVVVSGPKEDSNFNASIRLYDKCLKQNDAPIVVTHILNGARTVVLRSPAVHVRDVPRNPVGLEWEDE